MSGILIATKQPCPECDSSDAGSVYDQGDDGQWFQCFSCGHRYKTDWVGPGDPPRSPTKLSKVSPKGIVPASPMRGLDRVSLGHYGVGLEEATGSVVFPYGEATKIRTKAKDFAWTVKNTKKQLFGQDKFPSGGKFVTITEGEFDAVALFAMFGNKYPVVSVPDGAKGAKKALEAQFEWLDSFETIVLCFDNDQPGKDAAQECAALFPGKVKLHSAVPKIKDANEALEKGQSAAYLKGWWEAKPWRPDGVVSFGDLEGEVLAEDVPPLMRWPYPEIQEATGGIFDGELVTLTAGTGIGKSTIARELINYALKGGSAEPWKIGALFLEESPKVTVLRQIAVWLSKPFRRGQGLPLEDRRRGFEEIAKLDRFEVYSHLGVQEPDAILDKVRYMVRVLKCKLIVLDHVSIVISGSEVENERKQIDVLMTKLRALIEETRCTVICISHLSRPSEGSHEEGRPVSLRDLRGSGSIAQLSDLVIAGERHQQSDDPMERLQTVLRILKNRATGDVGPMCVLTYDKGTGRLMYTGRYVPKKKAGRSGSDNAL